VRFAPRRVDGRNPGQGVLDVPHEIVVQMEGARVVNEPLQMPLAVRFAVEKQEIVIKAHGLGGHFPLEN
jgi:hypothetical protein